MTHQQLAAIVAYLGAAFPTFDPSDDTVDVWWNELQDIDGDVAYEAMRLIVQTSEWPPSIAKFRAECRTITNRQRVVHADEMGLPRGEVVPFPKEQITELRETLKRKAAELHGRTVIRRRGSSSLDALGYRVVAR
jgi:hypothetical protein